MVAFFDAGFAERYPEALQPVTKPEGDALARFGANLLPLEYTPSSATTPVFTYPYVRSREALEQLRRHGAPHASHGVKMQYANPATGGYPMPTIGAFLQMLPAGFEGKPYRSTDGTVYCAVEGSGRSRVGDKTFDWDAHDVFVVKRKQHGSKGATVFRDPNEGDRVWVIFDWDLDGWQKFASDPEVPPIMQEAGHKGRPQVAELSGSYEA